MTVEAAFLEAIIENPNDDGPRLVYADWLEERGDPRSEFIRVQCERERLPINDSRRSRLFEREQELLKAHRDRWLAPLRAVLDPPRKFTSRIRTMFGVAGPNVPWEERYSVRFQRGFVEGLSLSTADFLTHATALFRAAPVLRDFSIWLRSDADVAPLFDSPHLSRVSELSLSADYGPMAPVVERLVNCRHVTNVRTLGLSSHILDDACGILMNSALMNQLKGLSLFSMRYLGQAEWVNGTLSDSAIRGLATSAGCRQLLWLGLGCNSVGDAGARAIAESAHLAGLEQLNLSDNRVGDVGAEALAASPTLTRIRSLDLSRNPISETGLDRLKARFGDRVYFRK